MLCIVLRTLNVGEMDKRVTLFSRETGRIDATARGCRKVGSPLLAATQVFACSEISFNRSKDGHYFMTQAEVKQNFPRVTRSADIFTCGSLLLELCERTIVADAPEPRQFALLASALYNLDKGTDPGTVFTFFIFKLLDIQGMRPTLSRCVKCGAPPANKLNISAGGAVCANCAGEKAPGLAFETITKIMKTPSNNMDSIGTVSLDIVKLARKWMPQAVSYMPKSTILFDTTIKKWEARKEA